MKTPRGKSGKAADTGKPQKTLLHFFQRQAQTSSPVEKVTCPGCSLQIPKSKINWHLDQDCKSKYDQKKGGKKGKSLKNKFKADQKKNKVTPRKQAVLSDTEDDMDDVCVLYDNTDANPGDSSTETCYITSNMVETQLFELENDSGSNFESGVPPQSESCNETPSPYFSPNSKQMKSSPVKRQEKVITYEVPEIQKNGLAFLEADWGSPETTPEEVKDPRVINAPKLLPPARRTCSPQTKSGLEVKLMLEEDWKSPSPVNTPKKKDTLRQGQKNISEVTLEDTQTDIASEDEFDTSFVIGTPKKLTLSTKSRCTSALAKHKKKSCTSSDKEAKTLSDNDDFEKVATIMSSPTRTSPNKSRKPISCELIKEEKNCFMHSPCEKLTPNEKLLDRQTPKKAPDRPILSKMSNSLSPKSFENIKKNITKLLDKSICPKVEQLDEKQLSHKLQALESNENSNLSESGRESALLFSPIRSPVIVTPVRSPSPPLNDADNEGSTIHVRKLFELTSPAKLSSLDINVDPSVKQSVSGQEDAFDLLSQTSSQIKRRSHGSPWKHKQALKNTGLLQNSSQSLSTIAHHRKRQSTPSPSGSASTSPAKPAEEEQVNDPAMYRHHKGYYLENFLRILGTVLSQPQDVKLLNADDLDVIKTFHGLALPAQKLYVRLFQRKIKWNRVSKIEYRDICEQEDTALYVNELTYAGFLHNESEMIDLKEVLQLLSSEELHGLCKQMKISGVGKKEDMVAGLLKFTKQQPTILSAFSQGPKDNSLFMKRAKAFLGHCCLVNKTVRRVFMRVLMLYALPRYDDDEEGGQQSQLTTLLMVNMGKVKFPHYDIIRNHSIFQIRDDLIRFESCSQIQADVQECMESQKWEEALEHCDLARTSYQQLLKNTQLMDHDKSLPRFLRRFTSISLLVYILTCSVECYQRLKNYQKAVEQLQELLDQTTHLQDYRGRWYDRLALNLEMHLKKPAMAVEVISQALSDPEVRKGHRLSISIRARRIATSARHKALAPTIAKMPLLKPMEAPKVYIEGRSLPADIPGYKRAFIRQDSDRHAGEGGVTICSVEELVLEHYKVLGYSQGLHREGATVNSLFGIYCWDILYAPISDVFRSPYQAAPLDLDDPNFYEARKEQIDKRLADLCSWSDEEAEAELERIWSDHSGEVSLVAWDLFQSVEHAKGLVVSMGLPVLAAICERLAKDHRFTRSGFPDLVVWNPDTKVCCIVEVKGPNDKLSTKQMLWLDYLLAKGAHAVVCHVKAIGAKNMMRGSPRKVSPKKVSPKKVSPKKSKNLNERKRNLENVLEENIKERTRPKRKMNEGNSSVKKRKSNACAESSVTKSDRSLRDRRIKRKNSDDFEEQSKILKENTKTRNGQKMERKNARGTQRKAADAGESSASTANKKKIRKTNKT
nr:fanconi-associated nuclease 1-like [Procambarus clarkii]XP_045611978.1 fanconi-associated nuclease 1-like [Procambarus clarkii]